MKRCETCGVAYFYGNSRGRFCRECGRKRSDQHSRRKEECYIEKRRKYQKEYYLKRKERLKIKMGEEGKWKR